MTAGPESTLPNPRAALEAARVVFGTPETATASSLWGAAQSVLQQVLGRPELTGQALVAEVRRLGLITLSDAHALVGLSTWADRASGAATNESERLIVREAWMALDHAVPSAPPSVPVSPYAPPPPAGTPGVARDAGRASNAWSPPPLNTSAPAAAAPAAPMPHSAPAPTSGRPRRRALWAAVIVAILAASAGGWWYAGRADRVLSRGIAAFQRGAREAARADFAQAAQLAPNDARPLVYLGRITREDGDLARARRFLTEAVRVAPGSAIAARELASLMLADAQPEIARRFYVRALELDPTDRTAQGFLGCALFRLQRYDEARRWVERAGSGDWQSCVPPLPPMPAVPMGAPGYSPRPPA
ncbi:tetratricopeptide repeat protein [Gemmatimonas sp.]